MNILNIWHGGFILLKKKAIKVCATMIAEHLEVLKETKDISYLGIRLELVGFYLL